MRHNSLFSGTVILVGTGLINRILGFVFRIYLSDLMGSEGMGLYQLITPVYFLAFSLCASGTQMAISRLASHASIHESRQNPRSILYAGMLFSVSLSILITFLIYTYSDWLALKMLMEPRLAGPLRILSLALPWAVISACLKAYFFSQQRMDVPAIDQLIEQLCRMGAIYLLAPALGTGTMIDICYMAVIGNVAGDFLSCLYCAAAYAHHCQKHPPAPVRSPVLSHMPKLLGIIIPLSANRILSQLLSSFENIVLPTSLQESGLSSSEALSIFGEFSGMAMPILFFPCVITNAISTNLLPVVARAEAADDQPLIQKSIQNSVRYTLLIGFLFTVILFTCGDMLGKILYHKDSVGRYITWLSLLCPFFYLESAFGGLMNGLGLHHRSFIHNIITDILRIGFILFLVPHYGFPVFFLGMAISLILCTLLNMRSLYRTAFLDFQPFPLFLIPALTAVFTILITRLIHFPADAALFHLLLQAGISLLIYAGILLLVDPSIIEKKKNA